MSRTGRAAGKPNRLGLVPFLAPEFSHLPQASLQGSGLRHWQKLFRAGSKERRGVGVDMHSFIQCTFIHLMLMKHPLRPRCWARAWPDSNEQKWMLLPALRGTQIWHSLWAHLTGLLGPGNSCWEVKVGSWPREGGPILFQVGGAQATADLEDCQLRGSALLPTNE